MDSAAPTSDGAGSRTTLPALTGSAWRSWDLINDQDLISRHGKWLTLYKRPGKRVIINAHGDLIVRPSAVEASYQRVQCGSRCAALLPGSASALGPAWPGGDCRMSRAEAGLVQPGVMHRCQAFWCPVQGPGWLPGLPPGSSAPTGGPAESLRRACQALASWGRGACWPETAG